MKETKSLVGKVCLVTGASRGIGRAIAVGLARFGARIGVHYGANRQRAGETLAMLEGQDHALLSADLSAPDGAVQLIEETVSSLGGLDILINNAGIYELHPIAKTGFNEWKNCWRRTLQINLVGPADLMFLAIDHMKNRGGGRIVNISSRGAFRGEPDAPAYGAAKAGLNALGQSLAVAVAKDNIYITTIAPGFVQTEMVEELLSGRNGDALRNQSPTGRVATPEEVADIAVFLATTKATYTTGTIIDVNGASYLRS